MYRPNGRLCEICPAIYRRCATSCAACGRVFVSTYAPYPGEMEERPDATTLAAERRMHLVMQ